MAGLRIAAIAFVLGITAYALLYGLALLLRALGL